MSNTNNVKVTKITLAGKEYEATPLHIKEAREWRAKFSKPFEAVVDALRGAGEIALVDGEAIANLVQTLTGTLLGSVDTLLEAVYDYCPNIAADREHIEANGYDEEAIAAFVEVVKLAYPLGQLMKLVNGLRK